MNILNKLTSGSERSVLVKKNIFGAFGLKGINIVVSFVLVPLTIGYVSSQTYGIWMTLSSILAWLAFFDVGFGNGLRNRIAENIALGNYKLCQEYISTTYFCLSLIFLPLGLLASLLCQYVDWVSLLNISSSMSDTVLETLQIVVLFTSVSFVFKTISVILSALQHNAYGSLIDTVGNILTLAIIFILKFVVPGSLVVLALVLTCAPLFAYIISSLYIYTKIYPQYRPRIKAIKLHLTKDIINLGVKFFIIQVACLVLYGTMNVIISNVSNPEYVTEYNVVYKYLGIPMMIFGIVIAPFWSAYTDAYTRKDFEWMKGLYSKLIKIVGGSCILVVILSLVYPIFFRLWLGDKVDIHLSMIIAVAIYIIISIWNMLHSYIVNGIGNISMQLYVSLIGTITNIPIALLLGRHLGAEGVIYAVSIFNLLPAIILYIQVNKTLNNKAHGIWAK